MTKISDAEVNTYSSCDTKSIKNIDLRLERLEKGLREQSKALNDFIFRVFLLSCAMSIIFAILAFILI